MPQDLKHVAIAIVSVSYQHLSAPARNLLLGLLFVLTSKSVSLGLDSLLSPLASGLGLSTLGVHLLSENLLTVCLSLGLVNLKIVSTDPSWSISV